MLRAQIDPIKPVPPVPASPKASKKRKKLNRDRDQNPDPNRDEARSGLPTSTSEDCKDDDSPMIDEYA